MPKYIKHFMKKLEPTSESININLALVLNNYDMKFD